MVFLEDDEYYKVPDFRQVDFFNSKNLDKNIIALRKSNNRIYNNDYYVETKETGSSKLPIMDSNSMQSSERVSGLRSASGYSQRVTSPFLKLKTEEDKNMRFEYNKIFSKKYQQIVGDSSREGKKIVKSNYVKDKIDEMRSKIFFIKSVYDYTYPQIMVQKLKTMKGITNKIRNKAIELDAQKMMKRNNSEVQSDQLFIRGRNYDYDNEASLFNLPKHTRQPKLKPVKFFKT